MPPSNEASLRFEGWRVAFAGGVGVFLASLVAYTFGIFLKPLSDEFSWSREAISRAYAFTAIAVGISAVPIGYLLDRYGARRVIIPCSIVTGCRFASLAALTANLWHLYGVFALLGIAVTGTSAVAYSRVVSAWFDERRGMALALVICGGAIGALVHPPVADAVRRVFGWRGAAFAFGSLFLIVGVPTAIALVREAPTVAMAATTGPRVSLGEGLSSRGFWFQDGRPLLQFDRAERGAHPPGSHADRSRSARESGGAGHGRDGTGKRCGAADHRLAVGPLFCPARVIRAVADRGAGRFLLSGAESFAVGALAAMCIGFGMGGESDVTRTCFRGTSAFARCRRCMASRGWRPAWRVPSGQC